MSTSDDQLDNARVEFWRALSDEQKLRAEERKLNAERLRYEQQTRWYPAVLLFAAATAGAGLFAAALAFLRHTGS